MIVFDLECREARHRFEGWFGSSKDFADQQARGLISCPECGSADVGKALMAPNLTRKGNQIEARRPTAPQPVSSSPALPPEAVQMMEKLAVMQAEALKGSRWVGGDFAEKARAMHYGEDSVENIHGQATLAEAKDLIDEGIDFAPLPFPVVPPGKAN